MVSRFLIFGILFSLLSIKAWSQSTAVRFDFTENKGQWDDRVKFRSEVPAGAIYLHRDGFTVLQQHPEDLTRIYKRMHGHGAPKPAIQEKDHGSGVASGQSLADSGFALRSHAYRVSFEGAAANPVIIPDRQQRETSSYFLGNDPSTWSANVKTFGGVTYTDVYPNIDLRYYSENGQLKYDWIVRPGGNPAQIVMKYEGADQLSISKRKELIIQTSVGAVRELPPYSYQFEQGSAKKSVDARYEIMPGNRVGYRIKNYRPEETLIIDPTVIFCTFSGGPSNYGFTATPGPDGTFFSGSIIFSAGFPNALGSFKGGGGGANNINPTDMLLIHFSADGSQRLHSTYLGGSGNDFPHSLYSDPAGNLVVLGRSYSSDYPGTRIGLGGGCDIVVTKLNADFSAPIGSLRIGGTANDGVNMSDLYMNPSSYGRNLLIQNYGDESRSEVVLDAANNIYIATSTQSINFPTAGTFGAATSLSGIQDGVVMKINPNCNALTWSRYLGGNGHDGAFVLEVDPVSSNVFVAGATSSTSGFPGLGGGENSFLTNTYNGLETDGFIARLTTDGELLQAKYAGTANTDIIYGVKVDTKGYPYIMGICRGSTNWPLVNASPVGISPPAAKQFVAKLKPTLDEVVFSTVFGTNSNRPNMSPVAFLVDRCENMYISGWGGWIESGDGPFDQGNVVGMPISTDAFDNKTDGKDFYFIVLQKNASSLLYATYFGQEGGEGEHVDGGTSRFDAQGVIYQAICANCGGNKTVTSPFPITPGVVAENNGALTSTGGGCNLAAVKIRFGELLVDGMIQSEIDGVVRNYGCSPLEVTLFDKTPKGSKTKYEWDFGDGSPVVTTTDSFKTHTYVSVGDYPARLVVTDPNSCNVNDTTYVTLKVRNTEATVNLAAPVKEFPDDCFSFTFRFKNNSVPPLPPVVAPFRDSSFIWDFGDGSPKVYAKLQDQLHTFPGPGTYIIKLTLSDTTYCNSPQVAADTLKVATILEAKYDGPDTVCIGGSATYNNTSTAGTSYAWDLYESGNPSPIANAITADFAYTFTMEGFYQLRLIAVDPNTCNPRDTLIKTITVLPSPIPDFIFSPNPPTVNALIRFENFSSNGAIRYKWDFGDGSTPLLTNSPDPFEHEFPKTGTYNVCLTAYNILGCSADTCKNVQALIDPLVDVPNAFTPGRGGVNSVVKVRGFGIESMNWKIYNRWGVKVFESTNKENGWDGTYNGQPQPMDVYMFILDLQFTDKTTYRRTGDITLIR